MSDKGGEIWVAVELGRGFELGGGEFEGDGYFPSVLSLVPGVAGFGAIDGRPDPGFKVVVIGDVIDGLEEARIGLFGKF